jgi:Bacterial type II and III secretion system protein
MNIEQEVSSIAPTTVQTSGAADIVTNKRTIQTKVLAEDGETIVLGGLIEDDITETESKVPLLGDIPVIGSLFSSKSHSSTKKNLLVFLRPTVLRGSEQMSGVTQRGHGQVYDLMLGRKNLADFNNSGTPDAAQDVGSVFEMPAKKLPWLVGGGGGVSEPQTAPVATAQSAPADQLADSQTLPWLTSNVPAAPVTSVESGSQQSPAPVTLTPPQ